MPGEHIPNSPIVRGQHRGQGYRDIVKLKHLFYPFKIPGGDLFVQERVKQALGLIIRPVEIIKILEADLGDLIQAVAFSAGIVGQGIVGGLNDLDGLEVYPGLGPGQSRPEQNQDYQTTGDLVHHFNPPGKTKKNKPKGKSFGLINRILLATQPSETYKIGAVALRPGITASLPLSTDIYSRIKEQSLPKVYLIFR